MSPDGLRRNQLRAAGAGSGAARAPVSAGRAPLRRAGGFTLSHRSGRGIDKFAAKPERVHNASSLDRGVSPWNAWPKPEPLPVYWNPLPDPEPKSDQLWRWTAMNGRLHQRYQFPSLLPQARRLRSSRHRSRFSFRPVPVP